MELERRVKQLERDMTILKGEIEQTLLDVRDNLSEKPFDPSQWHKRAWTVAMLNVLLALTLFTNIRFCTLLHPLNINPILVPWMRAFWAILAFFWLILQMYPLALLWDQEEKRTREAAWRNALKLFASNPGLTFALALAILAVAIISMLFPLLWFVIMVVLLVVVCANGISYWLRPQRRRQNQEKDAD
jgi:uncharacterized protein YacL